MRKDSEHSKWGFPGGGLEVAGRHLLELGVHADRALRPALLDDRRLVYYGSEQPTLARRYAYRMADLAAFLLATLRSIPYDDAREPEQRDRQIARLRNLPLP